MVCLSVEFLSGLFFGVVLSALANHVLDDADAVTNMIKPDIDETVLNDQMAAETFTLHLDHDRRMKMVQIIEQMCVMSQTYVLIL